MFFNIKCSSNIEHKLFPQPTKKEIKELPGDIKLAIIERKRQIQSEKVPIDPLILKGLPIHKRQKLQDLVILTFIKLAQIHMFPKKTNQYFVPQFYNLIDITLGISSSIYDPQTQHIKLPLVDHITKEGFDKYTDKFVEYDNIDDLIKDLETFVDKKDSTINKKSYKKYYIIGGISLLVILVVIGISVYFYKKKTPQHSEETKPIENNQDTHQDVKEEAQSQ